MEPRLIGHYEAWSTPREVGRPQKALDGCQEIVVISGIPESKYSPKQDNRTQTALKDSIEGKSKYVFKLN